MTKDEDPIQCALCGTYDDSDTMETYFSRPICQNCQRQLADDGQEQIDDQMNGEDE